jgi:CBS domain-containing protein
MKTTNVWPDVTAQEIMRTDVVTIPDGAGLSEAVQRLADARISGMPVTDEAGHVIGVISIRDILEHLSENPEQRRLFAPRSYYLATDEDEFSPEEFDEIEVPEDGESTVADVMTAQVFAVPKTASLKEVAAALVEHQVHRLLVTDRGKHVGLVSAMDVLQALVR